MKLLKKIVTAQRIYLVISTVCIIFMCMRSANSTKNIHHEILADVIIETPDIWIQNPDPFVAILNEKIFAGDPAAVAFLPPHKNGILQIEDKTFTASLWADQKETEKRLTVSKFFDWSCDSEGHIINAALFTVPSTQTTGELKLKIEGDAGFSYETALYVEERDYESDTIVLNKKLTQIRTTTDPERIRQAQKLFAILAHTGDTVYTQETFTTPIKRETRRTSFFGDKRVYKYANGTTDATIHAGIDYGIKTGSAVTACADGLVVLAEERIVTGNSVIIEHLPGVYSIYYHLSEIMAVEGDIVHLGDLIGLVGATGLATGPHLHWEIRAGSENTDPDYVSNVPLLDTEALAEKFYAEPTARSAGGVAEKTATQREARSEDFGARGALPTTIDPTSIEPTSIDPTAMDRWENNTETFFEMLHPSPRPGDPITLVFYPKTKNGESLIKDTTFTAALYSSTGRRMSGGTFFKWSCDESGHVINAAVFSVPATEGEQKNAKIKITGDAGFSAELALEIKSRIFELDLVPLNKSLTEMRTASDPEKTAQAKALYEIFGTTGNHVWTAETFTSPLARNTRRTSPFGDKRTYRYADGRTDSAIHAGIDYGVPTGTPVAACAAGRVVLAMNRIVTGNSVILEHYPGVYSIYYHLDSLNAEEGDIVGGGDIIGLSGETGLATGPHLHWEIRIAGENTNPDTLCDLPLLNTEILAQKIGNPIN
ncbi:MAG: hypothetical protein Ta2F_08180 [Termitinemataceae bacterium]|nr:MAG: hypothetical protein Ta2F_08180 [Termitinemataceae bacterium]